MLILSGYIEFYLEWSRSLKEKRAVKQRVQTRLVQEFHLSAMEDPLLAEERDRLALRYIMLCSDQDKAQYFAEKIEDRVLEWTEASLRHHTYEVLGLE